MAKVCFGKIRVATVNKRLGGCPRSEGTLVCLFPTYSLVCSLECQ